MMIIIAWQQQQTEIKEYISMEKKKNPQTKKEKTKQNKRKDGGGSGGVGLPQVKEDIVDIAT